MRTTCKRCGGPNTGASPTYCRPCASEMSRIYAHRGEPPTHYCPWCDTPLWTSRGVKLHLRACPRRPAEPDPDVEVPRGPGYRAPTEPERCTWQENSEHIPTGELPGTPGSAAYRAEVERRKRAARSGRTHAET